MKLYQNRKFLIGAIVSSILFTSLMVYRVGFYSGTFKSSASEKVDWSNQSLKSDESWMNIFQNFKKIGFSHRILENMGSSYKIHEKTVMKINTMGMVQDIQVESKSTTDIDFAIKKFDFNITSGSFNFSVKGEIKENTLYVQSGSNNSSFDNANSNNANKNNKPLEIALENRPYLTSGIIQATLASGLKQNQEMVLFIFDPSTLGQAPATVKMEEREDITIDGKPINAQRVSLSFKGAKQFAWVDNEGKVVKEEGLLGITLLRTDRKGAIEGTPIQDSDDLTNLVSVKSNKILNNPFNLKDITVKISGLDDLSNFYTSLNSGRQVLAESKDKGAKSGDNGSKSWVLKIEKESLEGLPQEITSEDLAQIDNKFKQPDAFIQSDDYKIRSFAFKTIQPSDLPLEKVKKLVAWIQKNIKRQPVVSLPNALSTLENRMGDCNEHAALLAAFCRAVGIPAKIEAGLVYLNGSFYYHAWNSLFVGRWITVDALFNQIPADVTHIAFSSGSQDMQLDIVGLIGRVQIEILNSN
ncbi:MAG: transglutaminase domain-containing protein [Desulfamplus sp.]|nr:transglutaminase domain-containing protein [Desulfamplus sp.]